MRPTSRHVTGNSGHRTGALSRVRAEPVEDWTTWESSTPRSLTQRMVIGLGLVAAVCLIAWLAAAPPSQAPPDRRDLPVDVLPVPTADPRDGVTFLGNRMSVEAAKPSSALSFTAVQWAGGSIAVPGTSQDGTSTASFLCDRRDVEVRSLGALPQIVVVAGAGLYSELSGCRPALPDVDFDFTPTAAWALPILTRLNDAGLVGTFDGVRPTDGSILSLSLVAPNQAPLQLLIGPSFGTDLRPAPGSDTEPLGEGAAVRTDDWLYFHCDRGALIAVKGNTQLLVDYLEVLACDPRPPAVPDDPVAVLLRGVTALRGRLTVAGIDTTDLSVDGAFVRFTMAGPDGTVRLLAIDEVNPIRLRDQLVAVGSGEVLRRADGGTIMVCEGLTLAVDPEYEPIALSALDTLARTAQCRPEPPRLRHRAARSTRLDLVRRALELHDCCDLRAPEQPNGLQGLEYRGVEVRLSAAPARDDVQGLTALAELASATQQVDRPTTVQFSCRDSTYSISRVDHDRLSPDQAELGYAVAGILGCAPGT